MSRFTKRRSQFLSAVLVLSVSVGYVPSLHAQFPNGASAELSVVSLARSASGSAGSPLVLHSTLGVAGHNGRILIDGFADERVSNDARLMLGLDLSVVRTAPWSRGRFELAAWKGSRQGEMLRDTKPAGIEARIHHMEESGGIWMGLGARNRTTPDDARVRPAATLGGWLRAQGFSMSAEISQFRAPASRGEVVRVVDTLSSPTLSLFATDGPPVQAESSFVPVVPPPNSACACRPDIVWGSAALVAVQWTSRRLEVSATGSASVARGVVGERWAAAEATLWLTPSIGVLGAVRRQRLEPGTGGSGGNSIGVGLRVRSVRPLPRLLPAVAFPRTIAFDVTSSGLGTRLDIRVDGARSVAIRGDFTGWEPVLAKRSGRGWTIVLPLREGVHQVLISIDGSAWMPPPGLPTAADGFGGIAGILVIGSQDAER